MNAYNDYDYGKGFSCTNEHKRIVDIYMFL